MDNRRFLEAAEEFKRPRRTEDGDEFFSSIRSQRENKGDALIFFSENVQRHVRSFRRAERIKCTSSRKEPVSDSC